MESKRELQASPHKCLSKETDRLKLDNQNIDSQLNNHKDSEPEELN